MHIETQEQLFFKADLILTYCSISLFANSDDGRVCGRKLPIVELNRVIKSKLGDINLRDYTLLHR